VSRDDKSASRAVEILSFVTPPLSVPPISNLLTLFCCTPEDHSGSAFVLSFAKRRRSFEELTEKKIEGGKPGLN
jgi:hypothetical protein